MAKRGIIILKLIINQSIEIMISDYNTYYGDVFKVWGKSQSNYI
jgi:hypothetical protein